MDICDLWKGFFFIIYVLVSESLFGLVKLDDLNIFVGMLILIKVNILWGLKNKKRIIDVICFKLFIYVFMESGSVY